MRNGMQKKVRQIDLETGEEIEVYNSITEAAYDNWMGYEALSDALSRRNGILRNRKLKFEYAD